MATQDEVYVISDDNVLTGDEVLPGRKKVAVAQARAAAAPASSGIGRAAGAETRIDRAMPFLALTRPSRVPIASTLSLFLCGAGQAYNGQRKLALLLFLTEFLAVVGHWSLMRIWTELTELGSILEFTESQILVTVGVADFLLIFFMLFNVGQAYHRAERFAMPYEGIRVPIISALASALIPGWGQILNGQMRKALGFLFFLCAGIYAAAVGFMYPFSLHIMDLRVGEFLTRPEAMGILGFGFLAGLIWMLSIYDAYIVARHQRDGN